MSAAAEQLLLKKTRRRQLREKRRQLSAHQQKQAATNLARRIKQQPFFLRSQHIAFYLAEDGEISPNKILLEAIKRGKSCYLPVVHPLHKQQINFSPYRPGDKLTANRFGILEPLTARATFPAWALDVVLMPLVGFDQQGNRLGMGGGFYDRAFAFKKQTNNTASRNPILVGLAHHCQEVASLSCDPWDIPLQYVATDKGIISVVRERFLEQ